MNANDWDASHVDGGRGARAGVRLGDARCAMRDARARARRPRRDACARAANRADDRRARELARRERELNELSRSRDAARVVSRVVKTDEGEEVLGGVTGRTPAMTPEIVAGEEEIEIRCGE